MRTIQHQVSVSCQELLQDMIKQNQVWIQVCMSIIKYLVAGIGTQNIAFKCLHLKHTLQ